MNNKDNKKSEELWLNRLFKQSGTSNAVSQNKAYFAHRYHPDHSAQDKNPFRALFVNDGKNQFNLEARESDFQQMFKHELAMSTGTNEHVESSLSYDSTAIDATEDSPSHSHVPLESRYIVLYCYSETLDTKTFRLRRQDGQHFDYLPGQYVTISVEIGGQEYKRSYSLASTPTRPGSLEITVKRDPNGGVVSNWLNDNLKEGDTLNVKGPYGKFTCARVVPPKILLLAAGSGIVPIMSMLRWLADTNARTDVILVLSFRTQYDMIFGDELKLIATRHKNIKLFITLTKESLIYSQQFGLTGRVNEKMLAACVPDVPERVIYLCGPCAFMTETKQYLQNLDLPAGQLLCESFNVNTSQVSGQAKLQHYSVGRPSRNQTGNHRVRFAKSGKTIIADGAITLLELAEKSGIAIGHECRAGNCGECMVKCLKGNIEMTGQAEIDDIDRKKGWVYACCAYPVSNVVLDV